MTGLAMLANWMVYLGLAVLAGLTAVLTGHTIARWMGRDPHGLHAWAVGRVQLAMLPVALVVVMGYAFLQGAAGGGWWAAVVASVCGLVGAVVDLRAAAARRRGRSGLG